MTRYAKRKLKYSLNENFNLLPYVEWDQFVTLAGSKSGLRVGYVINLFYHFPYFLFIYLCKYLYSNISILYKSLIYARTYIWDRLSLSYTRTFLIYAGIMYVYLYKCAVFNININNLDDNNRLLWILNNENSIILKALCQYMSKTGFK